MFDLNNGIAIGDAVGNSPALILSTTNGGTDWVSISDTLFKAGFSGDVWKRISFINSNTGYFYISGIAPNQQLYKTTNGGKNWVLTNYPNSICDLVKFYNENIGLAAFMKTPLPDLKYGISRTTDGGNSWETFNITSTAYPNDFEFIPGDPSKVWYVNLGSLYYSADTGRTWTEQKIYNGQLWGRDLVFTDSTHGWLICDSGKVFYTSNNGGIITGISSNKNLIPKEYLLMQNYPNPFNPSTTISYKLKETGRVVLTVFDIMGREIAQLINGMQTAGEHTVNFEGVNLPSGMYIYQLKASGYISSRKMLLLK